MRADALGGAAAFVRSAVGGWWGTTFTCTARFARFGRCSPLKITIDAKNKVNIQYIHSRQVVLSELWEKSWLSFDLILLKLYSIIKVYIYSKKRLRTPETEYTLLFSLDTQHLYYYASDCEM